MAGGIAAGAAAGSAFGPWGAAIGGALGAFTDIGGGGGAPMGPLIGGASGAYGNRQDGSGWSVNFSGTQVATPSKTDVSSEGIPSPGLATSGGVSPLVIGAALCIVAMVLLRRRKRG